MGRRALHQRLARSRSSGSCLSQVSRLGRPASRKRTLVKDGRVVWMKSYGYAVLDQPGPSQPMRDDSILWSASVAKILVTVAVLQQLEKRRLGLDDDISSYAGFTVRNPAWPDVAITWRMLLTHTSSLNEEDDERLNSTLAYGADPALSSAVPWICAAGNCGDTTVSTAVPPTHFISI